MRLLYVALTRAKEKLIITGYDKNLEKSLLNKENMISDVESKITISNIRKAKTYLDWLELVHLKEKDNLKEILEVNFYNKNKIKDVEAEVKEEISYKNKLDKWKESTSKETLDKICNLLEWKYKYEESTKIQGKASVSSIAKENKREILEITAKPKFLDDSKKLSKSEIGTVMHLIMQKLDFSKEYNEIMIKDLIQELIAIKTITENEAKYIDINKIIKFTNSKIYNDVKQAKYVYKEEPFYTYLTADEIYGNGLNEKILVQGIVDLYYINKNDEVILVDYKTDYVQNNNEQELIDKYKEQLNIYKRALEQALNKKVKEVYLYSIYLDKEIKIVEKCRGD